LCVSLGDEAHLVCPSRPPARRAPPIALGFELSLSQLLSHLRISRIFFLGLQYLIFRITDDKKFIEVEAKGEKTEDFKAFCAKLPDGDCRYAVLDVEINTKAGATANKLIFVAWCAFGPRGANSFGDWGWDDWGWDAGGNLLSPLYCPRVRIG
jgi:hypothetical protein